MKRDQCERESEVIAALRSGSPTQDLSSHLRQCTSCTEAAAVASAMLNHAAAVNSITTPLPAASHIWQQAQARRKAQAFARAKQGILILKTLAAAYVFILTSWCLYRLWNSDPTLIRGEVSPLESLADPSLIAAIGVAVATLILGAAALILLSRRLLRSPTIT